MVHIEVDYFYCRIHPAEPQPYQGSAQKRMEGSSDFHALAGSRDERLPCSIISPPLDHMANIYQKCTLDCRSANPFVFNIFYFQSTDVILM